MKRASSETEVQQNSMPSSTGSPLQANFPSFMSVFGNGSIPPAKDPLQPSIGTAHAEKKPFPLNNISSSIRRDSTSTFESNDSSPTTTIFTVDSSLTEPSPSSSPESPLASSTNSSFKHLKTNLLHSHSNMERKEQFANSFPMLPSVGTSDSPNKKMRNMKNLSVATMKRPSSSHLPKLGTAEAAPGQPSHAFSAPPTPAFIVPPKPLKRKPSNLGLTLMTPDSGSSNPQERPSIVPQTPSDDQFHTLRHLQSSSTTSGPLFSPTVAPEGGMRLPPLGGLNFGQANRVGPQLSISPNPLTPPIKRQTLEHVQEEPDYEAPLSREVKSPAYPSGPVCIYEPYVYLYLEPTQVEAQEFDVVINVAREVKNPFELLQATASEKKTADKGVQVCFDRMDKGVQASFDWDSRGFTAGENTSESQNVISQSSFRSPLELQVEDDGITAPSTPKAIKHTPEYIHIPWDHNTNVVEDLARLTELVDDRVRQRKRVLIHCQCGVSRSASLVVAYGLYKNRQLTVQEAYDAVKERSRWIGPNMSLIYQLAEFKSNLAKSTAPGTRAWHSWRALGAERPNMSMPNSRLGFTATSGHERPSQREARQGGRLSSSAPEQSCHTPISAQLAGPSQIPQFSPGPLTAPPGYQSAQRDTCSVQAKLADDQSALARTDTIPLSGLMDIDHGPNLTPRAMSLEVVQEDQSAPAGAIANDLRQIARDLDQRSIPNTSFMDVDAMDTTIALPGSWPTETLDEPRLTAKQSISDLPIGFSSLLSRRQGGQHLPLRQQPPLLATAPRESSKPFNPSNLDEVPPTPSLLSPRAAEFTASPFHRTAAGDLAGSFVLEQGMTGPRPFDEDPRSPHQKGEAPITRNIFDVI